MANSYTSFPDSVQKFNLKTDVSSSVYTDWKQFNTYISNGEFALASSLLGSNYELQKCIIDSDYINTLSKTVEEIQDLFLNNVQTYIHETVIDKGEWNDTTKYVKYNFVTYSPDNETIQTYECLRDDTPIGIAPTNTNYWIPRVIKGNQGEPGIGLSPRGTYSETVVYYQYDLVIYNDKLWYAIKDNPNGIPSETSPDWRLFFIFNGESISYDNSMTGIYATTVQAAIDETIDYLDNLYNILNDKESTINAKLDNKVEYGDIIPIDCGGTNADNAEDARANLGVSYGTTAGTVCQGNDSRLSDARTPIAHNQSANTITAGTLPSDVLATNGIDYSTSRLRNIRMSTTDLTAGSSSLNNGEIYIVYE